MYYPVEQMVMVTLSPGNISCVKVAENMCSAKITMDAVYTIMLTLRNSVGSTPTLNLSFDCK